MISEENKNKKKIKSLPFDNKTRFFTKKKLIVIGMLLILLIIELIRSNNYIQVENICIKNRDIPKSFDGCKIVQISDYHNHGGSYDERLLKKIEEQEPDFIFLTGDIADSLNTDIDKANNFLEKVSQIADSYLTWGNHDYNIGDVDREKMARCCEGNGITILENQFTTLKVGGEEISLVGTTSEMETSFVQEMLAKYPEENRYTIWLHHYPEDFDSIIEVSSQQGRQADLIFTGHAHGGLIQVPFTSIGIYAPGQDFFPEYTSGAYKKGSTTMFVSRGVGNSGNTRRIFDTFHLIVCTLESDA